MCSTKFTAIFALVLASIVLIIPQAVQAAPGAQIIVNLPSRTLDYYEQGQWVREFPVAIGKASTPTPLGNYYVEEKELNPVWYPPDQPGHSVRSGPENPLGYRWLGFSGNYGIHGTNEPDSIGEVVSNGCVRMQERDVEKLFKYVDEATPVQVTYDRIRIIIDREGVATIGIYPDVYGRQNITLADVRKKLMEKQLGDFLSDEDIYRLWDRMKGRQVSFAKVHRFNINQYLLPSYDLASTDLLGKTVKERAGFIPSAVGYYGENHLNDSGRKDLPAAAIPGEGGGYVFHDPWSLLVGDRKFYDEVANYFSRLLPDAYFNDKLFSQNRTAN